MLIERPPLLYRMLFPETIWRIQKKQKTVYLTFDDGPIPEVTPWVLDTLDKYGVKATFFCVGDNVKRMKRKRFPQSSISRHGRATRQLMPSTSLQKVPACW